VVNAVAERHDFYEDLIVAHRTSGWWLLLNRAARFE
jgi:hypothetical protein